jgi:redox-sensitive bicupin YhaK (pirin superfamily)
MTKIMHSNNIQIVPAIETSEGAGVIVHRTIGTPRLRNYDPFLLLDQISSDNPDDYIAGFPQHPHRGFITMTYMIDGHMQHEDNMSNRGQLGPGGAQWMKAASGVIHSEMPIQKNGLMRGFQLWINLPAANKMDEPEYQEYNANALPLFKTSAYTLKVIMGRYQQAVSPIIDEVTHVSYFDVQLHAQQRFQHDLSMENNSSIYLFAGDGEIYGRKINNNTLLKLNHSNKVADFIAGEHGARFLLISGKPLNEPIAQYGPFVMNTREQIDQAIKDYQTNDFVRERAWVNRKKSNKELRP